MAAGLRVEQVPSEVRCKRVCTGAQVDSCCFLGVAPSPSRLGAAPVRWHQFVSSKDGRVAFTSPLKREKKVEPR